MRRIAFTQFNKIIDLCLAGGVFRLSRCLLGIVNMSTVVCKYRGSSGHKGIILYTVILLLNLHNILT